ncbi:hypothetical protein ACE193_18900 [Bernardetia sp. OM2101]|uniref:hypothetical protein n=1 Tax=Bernardetia sp. OM2101 TaxID=3344876 RepID=UPI0035D0B26C
MQTFKKCYSQLFLIVFLLISSLYLTACDTSEDDVIVNPELPKDHTGETRDNVTTVSTASNMGAYIIDFPRLFDISQEIELELTTVPRYGRADIVNQGTILYRAFDKTTPRTDEFGYRMNGKDGILKIAYRPDSTICEAVSDYFYVTENTPLYDLDLFSNDNLCGDVDRWVTQRISIEPERREPTFIYQQATTTMNYYPPSDFVGIEIRDFRIETSNGNSYISSIIFEVVENTDSLCTSFSNNDTFNHTNLPIFEGIHSDIVVLKTDTTLMDRSNIHVATHFELDILSSLSTFNTFIEGQEYYYIPYLDNDSICTYLINDWDVSVDWNGISNGSHGLGYYPFYNPVFLVPVDTPKPFNFIYTIKNSVTGEEHTAEVVVN